MILQFYVLDLIHWMRKIHVSISTEGQCFSFRPHSSDLFLSNVLRAIQPAYHRERSSVGPFSSLGGWTRTDGLAHGQAQWKKAPFEAPLGGPRRYHRFSRLSANNQSCCVFQWVTGLAFPRPKARESCLQFRGSWLAADSAVWPSAWRPGERWDLRFPTGSSGTTGKAVGRALISWVLLRRCLRPSKANNRAVIKFPLGKPAFRPTKRHRLQPRQPGTWLRRERLLWCKPLLLSVFRFSSSLLRALFSSHSSVSRSFDRGVLLPHL